MLLLITERILTMSNTETSSDMFKDVWLARKESYREQRNRYEKIKDEINYDDLKNDMRKRRQYRIILNDIEILNKQIEVCNLTLEIDKLRDKNLKLKVGINDS